MEKTFLSPNEATYTTKDLKLSALLLSELDSSSFDISTQGNSIKKSITVIFPGYLRSELDRIVCDFINRQARVDVFKYNRNLNLLRDALRD